MKRFFFIIIASLSLASCAGLTHVTVPQSNINYIGEEIETQRPVKYTLTKTYIFGIGGMSARARNTNIIDELMRKANLQTNESLAYISVSRNINTFLGLFTTVRYTATGHVVRPVDGEYSDDPGRQKQPVIKTYQSTGGKKLVRELTRKVGSCTTHDDLSSLKEEVLSYEKSGAISAEDADTLIILIEDKAINL
jgi:hypothetical protein